MGASPSSTSSASSIRRLPLVLVATLGVLGVPIAAMSVLRASDAVTSFPLLAAAGVVLSVAVSQAGAALWSARAGAGDTVFGDLMVWGWIKRRRQERQLTSAMELLDLRGSNGSSPIELSWSRRVRLLEQLAAGLEARYPDTSGHSRRVARHAAAIAKRMGLPGEEIARIRVAAAVHDVGKIDVPVEIVNKPGALSEKEFEAIKRHAAAGATMVAGLGDVELTRIVRNHHERIDGQGYPDGLAGTAIPCGARIVAVADTFDAVTSNRPYRRAKRHREALALLHAEAGAQLDPEAVRAFGRYYSGIRPVALWAMFLNGSRQLVASFVGQAKLGGVAAAVTLGAVAAGDTGISQQGADRRVSPSHAVVELSTPVAARSQEGGSARQAGGGSARSRDGGLVQVEDDTPPENRRPTARPVPPKPTPHRYGQSAPVESSDGSRAVHDEAGAKVRRPPAGSGADSEAGSQHEGETPVSDTGSRGGDSHSPSVVSAATDTVVGTVDTVVDTVDSTTGLDARDSIDAVTESVADLPSVDLGGK